MAANPQAAAISLCVYDVERFDAGLIGGTTDRPPVTEELGRLRAQLSSLQSLLTLSKLMSDSGEPRRIVELAGTAVPSLARCRLVGVELIGVGWELAVPAVLVYRVATFWLPVLPGWLAFTLLTRRDVI